LDVYALVHERYWHARAERKIEQAASSASRLQLPQ
jgi:hypothetical protein